jgi:hypothetical protein
MSGIITATTSPSLEPLRRGHQKIDEVNGQISDFMQAQAGGEKPDPAAFTALLEKRMTVQQAMQAQLKLHEKPLKSVLAEGR